MAPSTHIPHLLKLEPPANESKFIYELDGLNIHCKSILGQRLAQEDTYSVDYLNHFDDISHKEWRRIVKMAYDDMMQKRMLLLPYDKSGCVTFDLILFRGACYFAYIGDCEAFHFRLKANNQASYFRRLNRHLHNPNVDYDELHALRDAHVRLERSDCLRVNGIYEVSRHLGNYVREQNLDMRYDPEVEAPLILKKLKAGEKHTLIIACDGLTQPDHLYDYSVDYTHLQHWVAAGSHYAEDLVEKAYAANSEDNITAITIEIDEAYLARSQRDQKAILFSVNDGHGGWKTSSLIQQVKAQAYANACREVIGYHADAVSAVEYKKIA